MVYPLYERAAVYRLRIGATALAGDLEGDDSGLALGTVFGARSDPCSRSSGMFKKDDLVQDHLADTAAALDLGGAPLRTALAEVILRANTDRASPLSPLRDAHDALLVVERPSDLSVECESAPLRGCSGARAVAEGRMRESAFESRRHHASSYWCSQP